MKITTFTSGPWTTDGRFIVQNLDGRSFAPGQPFIADCLISEFWRRNTAANAQLISVAPELLEACEFAAGILAKIPAFGDSIGKKVSKAQIGIALNRLMVAASKTVAV